MSNTPLNQKKKFTLPHIYVLLFGLIVLCTILTWGLPRLAVRRALD